MIIVAGNGIFGTSLQALWSPDALIWQRGDAVPSDNTISAVVLAVPARAVEEVAAFFHDSLPVNVPLILAAKGLSKDGKFLSDVLHASCPDRPVLFLAGGTFAKDIAQLKPVAATLAGDNVAVLTSVQHILERPTLVIETCQDIRAVELSAIMKNIAAIGTGATMGLELDESARAATFTRLFHEFVLFLERVDTRQTNLSPWLFALLGDWILTCSSISSRNYNKGFTLDFGGDDVQLSEGTKSARGIKKMLLDSGVDAPVFLSVIDMILEDITPEEWSQALPKLWKASSCDDVIKQCAIA